MPPDQQHPFVAQVPSSEQLSGTSMFIHGMAIVPENGMPTSRCWTQDIGVSQNGLTEKTTGLLCGTQSGSCNSTPRRRETSATW